MNRKASIDSRSLRTIKNLKDDQWHYEKKFAYLFSSKNKDLSPFPISNASLFPKERAVCTLS